MEEQEKPTQETVTGQEQPASAPEPSAQAEAPKGAPDEDIKKLKDELAESKDKYLRLYAEFENHRRRTAKERLDLISTANEQLLKALLPVADDLDRAEKSFREAGTREAEGVLLIVNKFRKTLEQSGLKTMDTSSGTFDPDLHEAITQIPSPDQAGKIIDVVEKGYLLNDKVIRHAKVVVGS